MTTNQPLTIVAAPLRKQIIELLRNAIVSFEYQPGKRLVEKDLCARFGVSRTVIREALRHLEAEGLIEIIANHGPIVHRTTFEDAQALYELREALETMAARLCAERATDSEKKALREALLQVASAYQNDDLLARLDAKDHFYRCLCEGSHNRMIGVTLRSVQARVQLLRSLSLQVPSRVETSLAELQAIVSAIDEGDGDAAGRSAAEHVRTAAAVALAQVADSDVSGLASEYPAAAP